MSADIDRANADLEALERLDAATLVRRAFERFGSRAAIGTSLQHSGLVLIDMAVRSGVPFRAFMVDTLRLHEESYVHADAVEKHFGIRIERVRPDEQAVREMAEQYGEYLFFDSPTRRMLCCRVRKDDPNSRVMQDLDCWLTGVRRDQADTRASAAKAAVSRKYGRPILKLSPLADWPESRVVAYVEEHGIPVNALTRRGYRSIGCVICTTPVLRDEDVRAGRWRWEKNGTAKECGLHIEHGAGI